MVMALPHDASKTELPTKGPPMAAGVLVERFGVLYAARERKNLYFGQSAMHKMHGDGALADCRSDALHVAGTNVTDGEDSGKVRLQHLRRTSQRPFRSFVGW